MSNLDTLEPIYFPGECNLDSELFLPLARSSESLNCMVGYFTSGSLRELAKSLSCYLRSSRSAPMKFIVSPNLSEVDLGSIDEAIGIDGNLVPLLFPGFEIDEKSLRSECVKALSYLIATKQLELRIALKNEGLFHTKCWLFTTQQGEVAVHGSGNATSKGLLVNFEQIVVSRNWINQEAAIICQKLRDRFGRIWSNEYSGISCVELNPSTVEYMKQIAAKSEIAEQPEEYVVPELLSRLGLSAEDSTTAKLQKLTAPDWLNYSSGPYAHQGKAITAWFDNDKKGILSIATGGGKTLTSLVAASLLNHKTEKLFVVIAVPTKPLLNQWAEDVQNFDVIPINAFNKNKTYVRKEIKQALRRLRHGASQSEVLLITHEALKSDVLAELDTRSESVPLLLVADEVHNLGSIGFKSASPNFFHYKMGLSATYERQFDQEGTTFLLDYFGGVVFEYSLEDAIGECLVPYEYHIHEVNLTVEEEEEFCELTFEIRKLSYAADLDEGDAGKQKWKMLCLKRRRLIEAAENKIDVLDRLLPSSKYEFPKSLMFCTDKYPDQLERVGDLLRSRSVNYHQITQEETSNPKQLSRLLDDFNKGKMQVLTSKRVIDEGFNVPQVEVAYLVASNTVKRQWIQRLGRVLRRSPKTGKTKAVIHDFLVLPLVQEGDIDNELVSLLMSEYKRLSFFSNLSSNGLEENGSVYKANRILELVRLS